MAAGPNSFFNFSKYSYQCFNFEVIYIACYFKYLDFTNFFIYLLLIHFLGVVLKTLLLTLHLFPVLKQPKFKSVLILKFDVKL